MFDQKKVYISGKVTGLDNKEVVAKFASAEKWVKANNGIPINPVKIIPHNPDWEWKDYMKEDLALLLDCNAILMLPCWKDSKSAKIEWQVAYGMELDIRYFENYY